MSSSRSESLKHYAELSEECQLVFFFLLASWKIVVEFSRKFHHKVSLWVFRTWNKRDFEELNEILIEIVIQVNKVKNLLIFLLSFDFLQKYFLTNELIINFQFLIKCTVFFFLLIESPIIIIQRIQGVSL